MSGYVLGSRRHFCTPPTMRLSTDDHDIWVCDCGAEWGPRYIFWPLNAEPSRCWSRLRGLRKWWRHLLTEKPDEAETTGGAA